MKFLFKINIILLFAFSIKSYASLLPETAPDYSKNQFSQPTPPPQKTSIPKPSPPKKNPPPYKPPTEDIKIQKRDKKTNFVFCFEPLLLSAGANIILNKYPYNYLTGIALTPNATIGIAKEFQFFHFFSVRTEFSFEWLGNFYDALIPADANILSFNFNGGLRFYIWKGFFIGSGAMFETFEYAMSEGEHLFRTLPIYADVYVEIGSNIPIDKTSYISIFTRATVFSLIPHFIPVQSDIDNLSPDVLKFTYHNNLQIYFAYGIRFV